MNKWTEILVGLILVIGTILVAWFSGSNNWNWLGLSWDFRQAAWIVLKGGIAWFVFFVGALFLLLGISDLRN